MAREERHENEQYFWTEASVSALADALMVFERPCCLCAPTLAEALEARGREVVLLDIDERFSQLSGFRHYDLTKPSYFEQSFDVIICDPPFFNCSLSQLFKALRLLAHFNMTTATIVSWLSRREGSLLQALRDFELQATELRPEYQTVAPGPKNDIQLYANAAGVAALAHCSF